MKLLHRLAAAAAAFILLGVAQAQSTVAVEPDVAIHYVAARGAWAMPQAVVSLPEPCRRPR